MYDDQKVSLQEKFIPIADGQVIGSIDNFVIDEDYQVDADNKSNEYATVRVLNVFCNDPVNRFRVCLLYRVRLAKVLAS